VRQGRALVVLAAAGATLAGVPAANAAVPAIVNNSSVNTWAESFTSEDDENRAVTVSFVVRHDPDRKITGIVRDTDFDGTDNTGTLGVTGISSQYLGSPGDNRIQSSVVRHTFTPPRPGDFSCGLLSGTRRVDKPLRFRVVDDTGQRSTSLSYTWRIVEDDQCTGADDYPVLEEVSQGATTATPGQNVSFGFTCDDADGSGSNDRCDRIFWRTRRLNDNVVSGLTEHDAEDNTARSFNVSFPQRGIYVVEAKLCGEDDSGSTCQNDTFWRIGSVMVNEATLPSGSVSFSGAGVVGTGSTQSINAGDAATAVASVNSGGGLNGATQVIEWDGDGNGGFERTEYTIPALSGSTVLQAGVSGSDLQQAVDTSTHGLRTVNARLFDNGAIDAADTLRRQSTTLTRQLRVNARPVAQDASETTDEDTAVELTLPASDADSQPAPLSYEIVGGPAHGTVELQGSTATYTPAPDYHGSDSFTFRVKDGPVTGEAWATSNTATVSLAVSSVNDPPVAEDQSVGTDEDTAVEITLAASDVDGDALSFAVAGAGPQHGTVECDGPACAYTPAQDYNGGDAFEFEVSDGNGGTATGLVDIAVSPVNDAPVAEDQALTTDEDMPLAMALASDVDGDELAYTFLAEPGHGDVSCDGDGCTYSPDADYNGADSFRFRAEDPDGESAEATVSVTVDAVNDAPVAEDVEAVTEEDTPVEVVLPASDVDDAELEYEVVEAPESGEVGCDGALCGYSPGPDFHGTDSFRFRVTDAAGASDEATATITVAEVLHATVLEPEPLVRVRALPRATLRFEARLTVEGTDEPLEGRTIAFVTGGQPACSAETDPAGVAVCEWTPDDRLAVLLNQGYDAVFAGESDYAGASAHAPVAGIG